MKNVDLSKVPRDEVRAAFVTLTGRPPTEDELETYIVGGTLTSRACQNNLCDWKLQVGQARFCTRCWLAITLSREAR